jgi:hypothetical protein
MAIAGSCWQAWRGYQLQTVTCHFKTLAASNPCKAKLLYALADGFTHGVLATSGWVAVWIAADRLAQIPADPSAGSVAFVIALGLFGLLGITGQVPTILRLRSQ